jgi:hypothetical protein
MNKKAFNVFCALGIIFLMSGSAFCAYQVGQTVADFTLSDGNGVPHSLYDYRGQVILLNFWTST